MLKIQELFLAQPWIGSGCFPPWQTLSSSTDIQHGEELSLSFECDHYE